MRWPLLVAIALLVAGCASTPQSPRGVADAGDGANGCDASRPAVSYGAPTNLTPPIPCWHPTNFSSLEPTIGVTRAGTVFFDQAGGTAAIEIARSKDNGSTWARVTPGAGGQPSHVTTFDPFLYVDPKTSRVFVDDLFSTNCAVISWSDDDGASWSNSITGCTQQDHQSLAAGPPVTSALSGYENILYRCGFNVGFAGDATTTVTCQKSTTGGLTWTQTGAPAYTVDPTQPSGKLGLPAHCVMGAGHAIVDAKGKLLLPAGYCMQPWLAMSADEGATWTRVQVAPNGMTALPGCDAYDDAGVGEDADGTMYYGWVAADRMPYLATSKDGGITWSAPRSLAFPGLREAAMPQMVVGPAGDITMAIYGSLDSPGQPWHAPSTLECEEILGAAEGVFQGAGQIQPDPRYQNVTWNAYLLASPRAATMETVLFAAQLNAPGDPVARGECGPLQCSGGGQDFIDLRLAPDGAPWAAFLDLCVKTCVADASGGNDASQGVAATLRGWPAR